MVLSWESVGHLIEEAAIRYEDKALVIYEGERVTYGEANRRINRTANALKALGVKKGDRVSVMLPNGFDFPITWLAIAKLGAVMVPTNINYKEHDLEYVLNDSQASAMVIHQDCLPVLSRIIAKIPELQEIIVIGGTPEGYHSYEEVSEAASEEFHIEEVSANDLLNIQYTSGTTGFPKGCMLTHRYWLLTGKLASDHLQVRSDDANMTAQPFYYMDPQWNTVLSIMNGIPLVVMHRFSPSRFWQTVVESDVTFFYVLGNMPLYLLKQEENPDLEKKHKLRIVICSGIPPQFHETFEKRWNVPWRELFGMTETGPDLLVPLDDYACVGSGAVGRPVPTKEVKVVDASSAEVPNGEIGEIVIRGEPMMLGYWRKPEETAKKIRDGWLYTGDLAYKDERGYFHLVGRIKDMVRRSGENISATELEGVLVEHEKIKAAAVVPVPDELRGEEVKAYLVLNERETRETVPPGQILEFARTKLAYFKIPRYIEYADDLPRTPSERVAKHKLIEGKEDLRKDSYDAVDEIWR